MAKGIELSRGGVAIVDDEDFADLNKYSWTFDGRYAVRFKGTRSEQKKIYMHREIVVVPNGKMVDHKDGNKLNNRKANLRICTATDNLRNKGRVVYRNRGSSKYKGVSWYKRDHKWMAQLRVKGKHIHLGYFDNEEQAAIAYDSAAKKHFGEFANINFTELD